MEEERIRREKAAEEARLLKLKLEKEALERERLLKEQQEREAREREEAEREKKRKDAEKKRLEEEAERKRREEAERKRQEEEQKRVEEERIKQEKAIARGKLMAKEKEAEDEETARAARKKKKKQEVQGARQKRKEQKASHLKKMRNLDEQAKEEREFANVQAVLLEAYANPPDDEIEEEDWDSVTDDSDDSEEHDINVDFHRAASVGQLFLKHTGKRRRKPQDRFVKVTFDQNGEPRNISWGSGSRHINFEDICTITWGHWTPVFTERKETLNPNLCFSVIGREQILDLQAPEREVAELWVLGLRALKDLDNEESDRIAQEMKTNGTMPGLRKRRKEDKPSKRTTRREKRTKSLMMLQQDLFVMTCTTVFRNIEEEGQYTITQAIREKFDAKLMYDEALQQDIPWRQWNTWVRQRIMDHLKNFDTSEEVQSIDEEDDKCSIM